MTCIPVNGHAGFRDHNLSLSQGDDEEPVQPSVRQHLPDMSQPHLLLQTPVSFLRHLHDLCQLPFELRPQLHLLPTPHPSAARGAALDGSALHRLLEDPASGGDVSHTLRAVSAPSDSVGLCILETVHT